MKMIQYFNEYVVCSRIGMSYTAIVLLVMYAMKRH